MRLAGEISFFSPIFQPIRVFFSFDIFEDSRDTYKTFVDFGAVTREIRIE
jgi:hypothetical protein